MIVEIAKKIELLRFGTIIVVCWCTVVSDIWTDRKLLVTKIDITLTAQAEQTQQPFLWKLGQNFNVKVNIIKANVEPDFGWIHVELEGEIEEIQRATAWLMTTGMHVDVKQRSAGVS